MNSPFGSFQKLLSVATRSIADGGGGFGDVGGTFAVARGSKATQRNSAFQKAGGAHINGHGVPDEFYFPYGYVCGGRGVLAGRHWNWAAY